MNDKSQLYDNITAKAARSFFHSAQWYVSLPRLWLATIASGAFLIIVRLIIGFEWDLFNYISFGIVLFLLTPVVCYMVKKCSITTVRRLPWILMIIYAAVLAQKTLFIFLDQSFDHTRDLFDGVAFLFMIAPLLYFVLADIRHREQTDERIMYLAYHDLLTGLPNRKMFEMQLEASIRQHEKSGQRLAVMCFDLDRFKNINDTFGHAFGDLLLTEASERIRSSLRAHDCLSRPGGDEFLVLVENIGHADDACKVAQKLLYALSHPFQLQGHELRSGCSIGIALYPGDGGDAVTLMKNADTAMYRMKERGKNGFQQYTADMNDTVIQKLVMEEWLNKALLAAEFMLHYQPQVDITTNRMNGMEALLRWNHPNLGMIAPGDFIPLAEETGLIIPIGEWVLRTACIQNKAWQLAGYEPMKIAVNISPIQFHQHNFVDIVLGALKESQLEPRYLELEITEGIAMYHVDRVIEKLQTIRNLGIQISMDDFGTGYSSLAYLKKFPIHKLKVAQEFVRDISEDPDDAAIVQAIMAMAHSLKLNVIAEGVETEEQLTFLRNVGCPEIQGYIYSRPLPAEDIKKLLQPVLV